jgi:hypothetical protein
LGVIQVLQICPGSARIKQDVLKVLDSMEKVWKADGILVEGLGKNYGRREENVTIRELRGDCKPQRMARDNYGDEKRLMHDDVKATIVVKLKQLLICVAGKNQSCYNLYTNT